MTSMIKLLKKYIRLRSYVYKTIGDMQISLKIIMAIIVGIMSVVTLLSTVYIAKILFGDIDVFVSNSIFISKVNNNIIESLLTMLYFLILVLISLIIDAIMTYVLRLIINFIGNKK